MCGRRELITLLVLLSLVGCSKPPNWEGQQVMTVTWETSLRDEQRQVIDHLPFGRILVAGESVGSYIRVERGLVERKDLRPLDDAVAYFQARAKQSSTAENHLKAGMTLKSIAQFDAALVQLNRAVELGANATTYRAQADCLFKLGRVDQAIAALDQTLRIDPKSAEAYHARGSAHRNQGAFEIALADFTAAIRLDPTNADTFNNRGLCWHNLGDPEQALRDINKSLRLNPSGAAAYSNRGHIHLSTGDLAAALSDLDRAIELDPTNAIFLSNRGAALFQNGDHSGAIRDCSAALRLNPNSATALVNRANAHFRLTHYAQACEDYEHALRLNPLNLQGSNGFCWLLATCPDATFRDGPRALKLAQVACERAAGKDASALNSLAAACAETGDFAAAVKYQQLALELLPENELFVQQATARLALYRAQEPYRELPAEEATAETARP